MAAGATLRVGVNPATITSVSGSLAFLLVLRLADPFYVALASFLYRSAALCAVLSSAAGWLLPRSLGSNEDLVTLALYPALITAAVSAVVLERTRLRVVRPA